MGIEVLEALKSHEHDPTAGPTDLEGSELKDST
jgi:hypothetical protein